MRRRGGYGVRPLRRCAGVAVILPPRHRRASGIIRTAPPCVANAHFSAIRASTLASHRSFSVYLSDGTRCRGAFFPGSTRLVGVYVHGFRSSVEHAKARFFLDHAVRRGYSWSHFDLPCHGRSEGRFRAFRISNALEALLEVMHKFRGAKLLLVGSSMGAWLSMLAAQRQAARSSIAAAVLVAPAFDFLPQYFQNMLRGPPADALREWKLSGARRFTDPFDNNRPYEMEFDALEDARRHSVLERPAAYPFPIRMFHGDSDEVVPIDVCEQFLAGARDSDIKLHTVAGGDHTMAAQLPLFAAEVDRQFAAFEAAQRKAG